MERLLFQVNIFLRNNHIFYVQDKQSKIKFYEEFLRATSFIYDFDKSNDERGHLELLFDIFDVCF